MPLEAAGGIEDLNPAWPPGTDPKAQGADHLRLIKETLQASFPGMSAPWTTDQKITGAGFEASDEPITGVGTPVDPTDAARKVETDNLAKVIGILAASAIVSYGYITPAGAIPIGSADFAVSHPSVGAYQVTWATAATNINDNLIVATAVDASIKPATISTYAIASNKTMFRTFVDGVAANVGFAFFRIRK